MQRSVGGEFQELAINAACPPAGCATISVKQMMQPGERRMAEENWLEGSNSGVSPAFRQMDGRQQPVVRHELRPLTTGEVLDRTFFLYRSNFWLYAGLASIAAGVNVLASLGKLTYLHFASIPATSPKAVLIGSVFAIVGVILYFVVYSVTHAATVSAVSSIYLGEQTSMGRAIDAVKGHWLRYCLIALWQSWSAMWAFSLLIAPIFAIAGLGIKSLNWLAGLLVFFAIGSLVYGLIAYIRNSLAIPAAVIENLTVPDAMRRSKQLVAGRKGRIFLLLLLLFALYCVAGALQFPFALLLLHSRSAEHIVGQIISLLVAFLCSSLIGPVASIALYLFYIDERVRREAFDIEFLMNKSSAGTGTAAGDATAELA
jgi:MFS family permease